MASYWGDPKNAIHGKWCVLAGYKKARTNRASDPKELVGITKEITPPLCQNDLPLEATAY